MFEDWTTKDEILETIAKSGPIRYSDLVNLTRRPDKTVWVGLGKLEDAHHVEKTPDGLWQITLTGKNSLQLKRLIKSVKSVGLEEHFWAPGKLGYRSLKSGEKMSRAYGEKLAKKAENIVSNAAFRSLRLAQSPQLEMSFDQYKKVQDLVGELVKLNPYSGPFALVMVFDPRTALQEQIEDWPPSERISANEQVLLEREIYRLWTEKAWIEHVFR